MSLLQDYSRVRCEVLYNRWIHWAVYSTVVYREWIDGPNGSIGIDEDGKFLEP